MASLTSSTRNCGRRSSKAYTCHHPSHLPHSLCALSKFIPPIFFLLPDLFVLFFFVGRRVVGSELGSWVCLFILFIYFFFVVVIFLIPVRFLSSLFGCFFPAVFRPFGGTRAINQRKRKKSENMKKRHPSSC